MAPQMSPEDSIALIKANLQEVLNPEIIDNVILKEKRPLKVYWGTAPTGKPHCGYFVPMMKIAELLAAGCEVKVLLADIHAFLDTSIIPLEQVAARAKYYEFVIKALLTAVGVDISRLIFVLGSSYQYSMEYTRDRFKLDAVTRYHTALKAGSEVVKTSAEGATIGGLQYPGMQSLDEEYLGVDAQFGGVDQRKIFVFAIENLHIVGYKLRAHLMNAMVPGLGDAVKMSASDADSKIDLLDNSADVAKKLKKAKCEPKTVEGNGVVAFVEHVILRALKLKNAGPFIVERRDQEPLSYESADKLKEDYTADVLTPQLLKAAVTVQLNNLLAPIIQAFQESKEWQDVEKVAYPPPAAKVKKEKKDKGDPAKRAAAAEARKLALGEGGVEKVVEDVKKLDV
ncbi:Nucleotidylyl transferase [Glarea lozoyensis ATCC 20868]|uniref:Tyrosine--tRNA ligase n=2 Tax=Glarea lozoyensis TaxID=101852 RepID=S3CLR8_GLAL2|nr:Nucleotidylyl transferase [Glarea lozoyensis ATCC 20868]EHL02701.1 putative Tyrosyl-tRNA synthetase, cytoplasmic [Glarea lozoyensis 74030]EPE26144.1 Nucleotidylyl transferase [Glarea lozoyensis ATCC 20868]